MVGLMADIQFNEPLYARPIAGRNRLPWLTGLVIRSGLARDEQGAQKVLLIVLVLAVAGIVWFAWPGGLTSPDVPLGPPLP